MIRDDLSDQLIHLTRRDSAQSAGERFVEILHSKRLVGGIGNIRGGFRCVCFTEAPVAKLGQILAVAGMRYEPFGIMMSKSWLFSRGGRPVIYQPHDDFDLLDESQKYRHVRFDGPGTPSDFTWEREWRLHADDLTLDPERTTAVVPTRAWEQWFQDRHMERVGRFAMLTGGFTGPVRNQPWHFIVLEDLGVPFPAVDPPIAGGDL